MSSKESKLEILDNIFLVQRIIDPQAKKVINFENNIKNINSNQCFDFWETGASCSNCISMRALNENRSFSKLESLDNKLYMVIAAPLVLKDKTYVLELIKDVTEDTLFYTYKDKTIEELRAEVNRLNMLVIKDELTNVFNSRYLNEHLPVLLENLSSPEFSLSIAMADIDKFKSINDTYGHLCGDYIIKEFSKLLDSYISELGGWTCRYGGDEFICVVENIPEDELYNKLNNFKETLLHTDFVFEEKKINLSCSFGACYLCNENINITDALNLVDSKLYNSKKTRNTIS